MTTRHEVDVIMVKYLKLGKKVKDSLESRTVVTGPWKVYAVNDIHSWHPSIMRFSTENGRINPTYLSPESVEYRKVNKWVRRGIFETEAKGVITIDEVKALLRGE